PEQREESFDTRTRMMATIHRTDEGFLFAVKGAPEAVLHACARVLGESGARGTLGDDERRAWIARSESLAAEGLRVLALAQKTADRPDAPPYEGLTLLGLAGLDDPPRETVKAAIERCREAGVRVVMVTGDHPATAANVARSVGITDEVQPVIVTGPELDDLTHGDRAWRDTLRTTSIFARVAPEQKLRLVEAFQAGGDVVGMTGDGVKDAPALKKADIGIAMGRRGTEVAREASDIVLKDDAMETIVMAIEQGRTIFNNIRRFVIFLLSGNLGQIVGVSVTAMVDAPLPLLPLQILFLNLLLDVFPALAIGVAKGTGDVMHRPPRPPREPILTGPHWLAVGGFGLSLSVSLLGVFAFALSVMEVDRRTAVTMAFLSYGFARMWHVFNMRSVTSGVVDNDMTRNPYVWAALALCAGLLAAAVQVPLLQRILATTAPSSGQWLVIVIASLVPLALGQSALAAAAMVQRPGKGRPRH
ncbi:MAG TPA: HAD-IC family P-type ATPase, partial [Gammaproteobacteria bacterium]|nr:HAD-IC family P-type ATPase [Gammaproteobacteria bacterium]